jgi:hypothetical protein
MWLIRHTLAAPGKKRGSPFGATDRIRTGDILDHNQVL